MGNQFATCADCGNGELQYWLDNTNVSANPGDLCNADLPNCTDVTSPSTEGSDVWCVNPYLDGQCGLEDYRELAIPNCGGDNRTVYKVVAPDVPDPSVCSTSCAGSPYEDDNIFFYPDACCCELDVEDNLPLCSAVNSSHVDGCCRNDNITTLECGLVDVTNSYLTDYPLLTPYEGGNCVNGPLSNTIPQDYYDVFRIGGCPTPTPTSAPTCKDDVVCKPGVCFAAIPGDECPDGTWALHDYLFKVHPHCTPDVPVGHLCEGSGECGTNQHLNNCKALEYHMFNIATDLYRRVECCDGDAAGWGTDGWTSDGWLRRGN